MSPIQDYEAEDVLLVSKPEQLRALGTTPRVKIILLLREGAHSISELSKELSIPKGTVGHHMKVLEEAGLVRVVSTRKVRALTERYYGRVARLFLFEGEAAPDAVPPLGAATLRDAADQVERSSKVANFALVRSRLAPADARRFDRRLKRLVDDFQSMDDPDGSTFAFSVALWNTEPSDA